MPQQPVPGWYSDPSDSDAERWWTGEAWTANTRPKAAVDLATMPPPVVHEDAAASTPPGPATSAATLDDATWRAEHRFSPDPTVGAPEAAGRRDDSLAWILAFVPLLFLGVDLLFPEEDGYYALVILGLMVLNIVLATVDAKALSRRGIDVNAGWAWLLIPVYLIQRTRRAKSTAAIPVIWFIACAASFIPFLTYQSAAWEFDNAAAETEIQSWVEEQGFENVDVDCQSRTVVPGDTLLCAATDDAGDSADIKVTILEDGMYEWQWYG